MSHSFGAIANVRNSAINFGCIIDFNCTIVADVVRTANDDFDPFTFVSQIFIN